MIAFTNVYMFFYLFIGCQIYSNNYSKSHQTAQIISYSSLIIGLVNLLYLINLARTKKFDRNNIHQGNRSTRVRQERERDEVRPPNEMQRANHHVFAEPYSNCNLIREISQQSNRNENVIDTSTFQDECVV